MILVLTYLPELFRKLCQEVLHLFGLKVLIILLLNTKNWIHYDFFLEYKRRPNNTIYAVIIS